ncbi:unnamed protein product [Phaedon cochleariae]|uniref:PHD-type domain-containing protein n=1 Tax=Phaedon cochleariae TaxID=80249 RepID=A0A9P0GSH4_PHACE|nr:unnamed protein product [Phaedon cochleariae]
METETLSKYEQECPDKEDISHDGFGSATEKRVSEAEEKLENKGTETCDPSSLLENDSDEDVEEEEKLMLSPTHSEKDYDTDEDQEVLSAEENGRDDDSDEEDEVKKTEVGEKAQERNIVEEHVEDKEVSEAEHQTEEDEVHKDSETELEKIPEEKGEVLERKEKDLVGEIVLEDEIVPEKIITDPDEKEADANLNTDIVEVDMNLQRDNANIVTAELAAEENVNTTAVEKENETLDLNKDTEECGKEDDKQENDAEQETAEEEVKDKTSDKVEKLDTSNAEDGKEEKEEISKLESKDLTSVENSGEESENAADKTETSGKETEISGEKTEDTGEQTENSTEKTDSSTGETENAAKETENSGENNDNCPLLKETLTKPKDDNEKPAAEVDMDVEMDEMEDFDPSLLCPDMSMEVEENPVITDNDALPPDNEGSKSLLSLCEPIFSTFVDEITGAEVSFGLSLEEISLREQTYGQKNPVQFTKIHCTACNVHLGSALDSQGNRFVHPLLKVLICKKCYHFYTSGEFEKDEDGSELYCRWCGQGGKVMCCSTCEKVFCRKCIRINFDRKKMMSIRDSDEWKCFACNPSQLIHLRIHCSAFMDYVQREMSRVSSAEDPNAFLHTDYSRCCLPVKKKAVDTPTGEPKRKRRKNVELEDPDYDPLKEEEQVASPLPPASSAGANAATPANATPGPSRLSALSPKSDEPNKVVTAQTPTSTIARVGSVNIRPMGSLQRPKVQVMGPAGPSTSAGAGYSRLPPTPGPRGRPSAPLAPRLHTTRGPAPRGPAPRGSVAGAHPRPPVLRPLRPAPPPAMKHEWFEKTVRAAARVNSNLSYTLTQLNRAQANATSVEGLAVVHNKLQEILSTSINSLIQIRKNLRSEFIVGIKNIRFPSKNPPPATSSAPAKSTPTTTIVDDDVIIVSPSSSPPPPPAPPAAPATPSGTVNSAIDLPPSVSFFKRSPNNKPSPLNHAPVAGSSGAGPSGAGSSGAGPSGVGTATPTGRPFLRVKSFSALQSVSSECITIPDDPPPEASKGEDVLLVVGDSPVRDDDKEKGATPEGKKDDAVVVKDENRVAEERETVVEVVEDSKETGGEKEGHANGLTNGDDGGKEEVELRGLENLDPLEKKKILNTKIVIEKSEEIDELAKSKFGLQNGEVLEL